jgi:hypothetical protein
MRSERDQARSVTRWAALWAGSLAGCALLAGDTAAQVQVTSLEGTASVAGSPLSLHAEVGEDLPLELATGGRSTLLLADQALVQICGGAKASFAGAGNGSPGAIELRAGELTLVALARPGDGALEVHTPSASIALLGAGTHISVAPGSGDTVVSALESPLRVSGRDSSRAVAVDAGQQLTLRRGETPGDPRAVSRESLAHSSACFGEGTDFGAALRADRAILVSALPAVGANSGGAIETPASDLQEIVRADFPPDGLPLEGAGTPSALVTELNKRGMDEEVCDPITCNPVYQLDPPGPCGVPPEKGCIP